MRPLRLHVPGAFHHVTLRGNHRQEIFFTPADRQLFEDITAEVIERLQAHIHAYCWMTNHVHVLIQVGTVPLGRLMLRIASRYARTMQARLRTTGHFFERRYYSVLVDADEYMLELVRYIHLNPVRAGLVRTPADYRWSSHLNYLGARSQPWVTTDFTLKMLHAERRPAIEAYRRFMAEPTETHSGKETVTRNPNDARALGSDQFLSKVLGESWKPRSHRKLEDLVLEACQRFDVTPQALIATTRQRHITRVRAWVAHQALTLRIASLSEVARSFHRSESSLRESVRLHFNYP